MVATAAAKAVPTAAAARAAATTATTAAAETAVQARAVESAPAVTAVMTAAGAMAVLRVDQTSCGAQRADVRLYHRDCAAKNTGVTPTQLPPTSATPRLPS